MIPSNVEILAWEETPLGPLCLRRRELLSEPGTVVTEITLDHEFLMCSLYNASEWALARIALEMHVARRSGPCLKRSGAGCQGSFIHPLR